MGAMGGEADAVQAVPARRGQAGFVLSPLLREQEGMW